MNCFIFRRDFRLIDNKALDKLSQYKEPIVFFFIFTPEQSIEKKNNYYSNKSFHFLCESLEELKKEIEKKGGSLIYLFGDPLILFKKINKIKRIAFNKDYTPYSSERDNSIKKYCETHNIECIIEEDYLLSPLGTYNKDNGDPYLVYTPFKNNVFSKKIPKPNNDTKIKFQSLKFSSYKPEYKKEILHIKGGRSEALKKMNVKTYQHNNFNPTTLLSAYIKYGCISIREVYWKIQIKGFQEQIIWREFFYYIYAYNQNLLSKSKSLRVEPIKWSYHKEYFRKWCDGETGYPIVDASMKELNQTGYMHNRGRLITANFLTHLLGIDWRWGEQYFAKKLIDYDPIVNNGNWQWCAGTGVDRAPYLQRIFNPWTQGLKHDVNAIYIKKWLPQLKEIDPKLLHKPCPDIYIKPMVDYHETRIKLINKYK